MPTMSIEKARTTVRTALEQVANFDGDIESFTFQHWHDFHKHVFLATIVADTARMGYRLLVSSADLEASSDMKSFIKLVKQTCEYLGEPAPALSVKDGDLQ